MLRFLVVVLGAVLIAAGFAILLDIGLVSSIRLPLLGLSEELAIVCNTVDFSELTESGQYTGCVDYEKRIVLTNLGEDLSKGLVLLGVLEFVLWTATGGWTPVKRRRAVKAADRH